jgi:hypothetical protein
VDYFIQWTKYEAHNNPQPKMRLRTWDVSHTHLMNIRIAIFAKFGDTKYPVQSNKLLLAFASTITRPRPYFCSFRTLSYFEMWHSLRPEGGSDYYRSLPLYWGVTSLAVTLTYSLPVTLHKFKRVSEWKPAF